MDVIENVINGKALGRFSIDEVGAPIVFSGHYHVPKMFETEKTKFIYGGSLLPHSFVDASFKSHGILVIEVNDEVSFEHIPNPFYAPFFKFTLDADGLRVFKDTIDGVVLESGFDEIYLSVTAPPEMELALQEFASTCAAKVWLDFRPMATGTVTGVVRKMRETVDGITDKFIVDHFVDQTGSAEGLDLDKLKSLGVELMSGTYEQESWL